MQKYTGFSIEKKSVINILQCKKLNVSNERPVQFFRLILMAPCRMVLGYHVCKKLTIHQQNW